MKQISFAQAEHQNKKKVTRRERFLAQMESLVPWQRLIDALSPSYFPNAAGKRGRPPIGLERMLRIYFLQQWYALADEALEDAIYDSQAMRDFVGIDLAIESVPDATTLLRFRHLLEKHALTQRIFEEINAHLAEKGLFMREGTIVDATIVAAAPSTKNKAKQRDPEMKQTRKCNQWYFGMKAHIGVDAVTGLTHTVVATSANVADVTMADHLVRDDDKRVHADAGYIGMGKRLGEEKDAEDSRCCIAAKRGGIKKMEESPMKELLLKIERTKASIRAKVEHPFHVIKNLFGYRKVRYKGLAKNQAQLFSLFGLANLVLATRCEGRVDGASAP
ncbi:MULTISPECIES: IS5 family transposase [Halomonadaceae]|jgi:IS5 family transposase|uniref:Transposase, IS4 family n=1 Tax=Vreelandella aquamarina TaxID=77097 RepID=A0A1N6DU57_9GAMM|nr:MULTISPECIES: IS5 family transposase [Halomonas]MBV65976.1 IS5/IS1182 family transposase [Halomonas sp.]MCC4289162.1 IS5 family transposase [Halomonas meridiana]MCP1304956.1 IS5 family transposase [Halomonas sp. R1t8]MCP1331370.1 IS5 family transposase [Halomonas sp. R1t4]SIN63006.1 transposase, IS4 family [Halomonas meridiana]